MRTIMTVARHNRTRIQIHFRYAHSIFHKKNLAAPAWKSLLTAILCPVRWRLPQLFILQQFDRDIAKGMLRKNSDDVSKISRRKARISVAELDIGRRLTFDLIGNMCIADHDINIVMPMAVQKGRSMRRDPDIEDAYIIVLKDEMVRGFSRDLNVNWDLRRQQRSHQKRQQRHRTLHRRFHAGDCSTGP